MPERKRFRRAAQQEIKGAPLKKNDLDGANRKGDGRSEKIAKTDLDISRLQEEKEEGSHLRPQRSKERREGGQSSSRRMELSSTG